MIGKDLVKSSILGDYNIRVFCSIIIFLMIRQIVTKQIILIGGIFGVSLCLVALFLQVFIFPNIIIENEAKVQVVITPMPNALKTQAAQEIIPPSEKTTETPVIPGVFTSGMEIIIAGTEGEGLNVRQSPGIESPVVYLAQEGESYLITDGPKIQDGLIWWLIEQTEEGIKTGWAVQDYFSPTGQ